MLHSWRLNYTHDDCHCTTADQGIKKLHFHCCLHYLLMLKTLHNSHLSRCQPVKSGRQNPSPDLRLNRRKGDPKLLLAKLSQTGPLQNVQIRASCLPTTKDGPRTFWPSSSWFGCSHPTWPALVHNCLLHHSHWNNCVVHLVWRLVVNCC